MSKGFTLLLIPLSVHY